MDTQKLAYNRIKLCNTLLRGAYINGRKKEFYGQAEKQVRLKICIFILCSMQLLGCQASNTSNGTQKVYKSDGSVQCGFVPGTPLTVMALELTNAGIDVICMQQSSDGMAYPAVCGAGTGIINVYTINSANLQDAAALGFQSVLNLPSYLDTACK